MTAISIEKRNDSGKRPLRIVLPQPRGFCAGVVRAIDIVEKALQLYGTPVFVRHEIVHNKHVVDSLREKGAVFVEQVDEVPVGAVAIFSAHGVSQRVEDDAKLRDLHVLDATCPLVTKVHNEAKRYTDRGFEIVLIGHEGHPEIEGTMGRVEGKVLLVSTVEDVAELQPSDKSKLAYITQTTLSVDDTAEIIAALKERFPDIEGPSASDICYATQNRQDAVKQMIDVCDLVLVIGAQNSSNSNRLREISETRGVTSYLINDANDVQLDWFDDVHTVGITAGASAPERLVQGLVEHLGQNFDTQIDNLDVVNENVTFRLPKELRSMDNLHTVN